MEWTLYSNEYSYDFRYDKLHRLTDAKYDDEFGDEEAFMTNYGYDKNGNIDGIMRQALNIDNEPTPLDEMWLYYTGNQLQSITNYADPDDFEDYTPYPVSESSNPYSYDQNGNTTKDLDRNISSIQYNLLNLPRRITYTDGSMATYTYNSLGEKLQVAYSTSRLTASLPATNVAEKVLSDSTRSGGLRSGMTNTTVDYCGNLVYNGNSLSRVVLGNEGLCRLVNGTPTYYFFIKDHLGSTRAVVQQNGVLKQTNQYYPYGKCWDSSTFQPYLYNGKEIDLMHDLEWYDYGARMYEPGLCRFMTMDPLCEKYYNVSPYAYCVNNPINAIDPDGKQMSPIYNVNGDFLGTDDEGLQGVPIVMDNKDFRQGMSHAEALSKDKDINSLNSDKAFENFASHYNQLPNRPDYDGYLTLEEANNWYREGNGQPLYTDIKKIDLSRIRSLGDKYVGQLKTFNLLISSNSLEDGLVYGNITLKRYPNDSVRAYADKYDFDMKSWKNPLNWGRNCETIIGEHVAGKGKPFEINIYGSQKLKPIYP